MEESGRNKDTRREKSREGVETIGNKGRKKRRN